MASNYELAAGMIEAECREKLAAVSTAEEALRIAFEAAHNHWMFTDEQDQFKGAIGAALIRLKEGPEFQRLEKSIKALGKLSAMLNALALVAPHAADALNTQWLIFIIALLITLLALYLLGWLANRVIGQRFINAFDGLLARIPVVQTIYGGTKKLMAVLQNKPSGVQRVVLVEFPRRGMKVVGFVTRVMVEDGTGREMAAVFVPTTPNPTGGYLVVLPLDELTPTDWTMDQAMAFIISGGAVAPDTLPASPVAPP